MNYKRDIYILTQRDLIEAGCFDFKSAIGVIEKTLIEYSTGKIIFPDKVSVIFNETTQDRINCLPAGLIDEGIYGMKWVSVFPENPYLKKLPNLSAVILLSELENGFPIAFMEGTLCSNMRTAAMSAIAAKFLSKSKPESIGFIGAGEQAKSHFLAMKTVFPSIRRCSISADNLDSENSFIEQMNRFYSDVEYMAFHDSYKEAVVNADIIITAISGQSPILKADWIREGVFYCHVGGFEDEYAVAKKANKIICDDWNVVKHRTQTISRMYKEKILDDGDIYANLYEIVSGKKHGRENDDEFIYYNGVGLSYVDVALAYWMYKKAREKKVGSRVVLQDKSMFDYDEGYIV